MSVPRSTLLRALHAEGRKHRLDHDALHDLAAEHFGSASLSTLDATQLGSLFQRISGRDFRLKQDKLRSRALRKAAGTEGRKDGNPKLQTLVSPDQVEMLYQVAYGKLGWSQATLKTFIRRQLKGRDQIRTVGDLNRILWPVKRIARQRVDAKSNQ